MTNRYELLRINPNRFVLITKEDVMEKEEILILDAGDDSPISPMGFCCAISMLPYRSY